MSTVLAGEQMSNSSTHEQAIQGSGSGMSNGSGVHLSRGSGTSAYDPDRPPPPRPGGASANSGARKMRRIIDDDDDDDDDSSVFAPPQQQARAPSMSSKHGSSSSHVARGGMNGGRSGDRPQSEKKRIIPGPPKAKTGAGISSQKSASAGVKRVYDDDDDEEAEMDLSFGVSHKKTSRDTVGGSGSSRSTQKLPSKNGVRKEASSFKIPKREGASPRPAPASGSPRSGGGGSYSRSSSSGASGMRKSGHVDSGYESKPSKDLNKKRPDDSRREIGNKGHHREDPAKANDIRKRKLEMEQRLIEEERRKKKRMEASSSGKGSVSTPKSKVKAEPVRRVTSSSSGKGRAQRPKTAASSSTAAPRAPERKFKEKTRKDKIEEAMKVYKWWEEPSLEHGKQWESLEHNGAHFAPEYKPHSVKLKYDGEDVYLTPLQEEIATFYASMPLDGPQLTEQASIFNKNFFEDFKAVLGRGHKIKKFDLLDFSAMRRHLDTVKQIKRAATDGEKAVAKTEKEELKHKYCYSIVDGHLEMVGNFSVEPPGLFRGRGKHPKTGKVKARVMPSDIALNCGESVCVPRCNVPGYAWQNVQHDPSVTWLGKWDGNLAGTKYMMLAASSSFKGKSDMAKYNKAMALKGNIDKIRKDYTKKLNSANAQTKQIATAVWIIDKLALRVGGEKGDDEADTVGCCSLRREHITFNEDSSVHEIDLEFLGKDSMLFKQTIDFDKYGEVGTKVFQNIQAFCKNKRQSQEVFDRLDPSILNQHLQSLMPGLTAKVFRTYNASETLQTQLPGEEALRGLSVPEKVALYNGANREVAILCNHQRTVSSAQKEGLEKMQGRLEMLKRQKKELRMMLQQVTQKKSVRLKSSDKSAETKCQRAQEEAKAAKAKAKTNEEKIAAVNASTKAAELKKALQQSKAEESHLFMKSPSAESLKGRIENWANKIKKLEIDLRNKDDNKEVSLTTSKINYMDPRVSVAWCKRHEVPVEKVFAATLQAKFVWAMNVPPNWEFSHLTLPQFQGRGKVAAKASATKTAPKTAAPVAKVKNEVKKEEVEDEDEDDDEEDSDEEGEDDSDDEGGDDSEGDSDEDDDDEEDNDEEDDDDDEGDDDDDGDSDFGS